MKANKIYNEYWDNNLNIKSWKKKKIWAWDIEAFKTEETNKE